MQRFVLLLVLGLLGAAHADVTLASIFASQMVIQRETQAPVWGWAEPGEKVAVSTSWGAQAETVADAAGAWRVVLPTPAAGGPFTITVTGQNTIELTDVLAGEVWLCSGQSNMQWSVKNSNNSDEEIANADHPQIRLFSVHNVASPEPLKDLSRFTAWAPCSPANVGGFSAAGYFFGRKLHQDLGVPVGLINSSWGGTGVEAWTPWEAQADDPVAQSIRANWDRQDAEYTPEKEQAAHEAAMEKYNAQRQKWEEGGKQGNAPRQPRKEGQPRKNRNYPANLYNAMIHPIATFPIRGAIWYQGEHNAGRGAHYEVMLTNLLKSWRQDWGYDFPFYAVQLPNYLAEWKSPVEDGGWPQIREAFVRFAENVPNTGTAITIDIGEAGDIHPKNKQDVGDRLARLALHQTYGKTGFAWCGPIPTGCEFRDGKAIVTFATGGAPLAARGGGELVGFALTGTQGVARAAKAVIVGEDKIEVTCAEIPDPCMVHYAWANNPAGVNLVNQDGLPATPFRFGQIPPFETFARQLPEEAAKYELLYAFDPLAGQMADGGTRFVYPVDNAAKLAGPVKKVAYYLAIQDTGGNLRYAFVSMDPFAEDLAQLGVPAKATGARFQQKVTGATVKSNVPGLATGDFPEGCNIEFWDCNYGPANAAQIPGADDKVHDFGDQMGTETSPGYGSMQIHNWQARQSIICFNKFGSGKSCDLGIGNSEGNTRDWTFTSSAKDVARAEFKILVLR